jgi:flagellar hook-length control protein FliK
LTQALAGRFAVPAEPAAANNAATSTALNAAAQAAIAGRTADNGPSSGASSTAPSNNTAQTLPGVTALLAAQPATTPAPAEWAPIKLAAASPNQWGQPLQQALGERLSVQLGHGIENAVIRLDPPMLGSLEIAVRHQGGALQVHLSASDGEVLRQLQGISDSLRQDLGNRQYGEVTVTVSGSRSQAGADADGQGSAQREQTAQQQPKPGRALAEAEQGYGDGAFTLAQQG